MSKYRNIPQATKDNVLHYINQVYDEAYELGYQRGRMQSDRDIKSAQQMIKDAITRLHELKQEPKRGEWVHDAEAYPIGNPYGCYKCDQCGDVVPDKTNFCPNCGADMRGDEE